MCKEDCSLTIILEHAGHLPEGRNLCPKNSEILIIFNLNLIVIDSLIKQIDQSI